MRTLLSLVVVILAAPASVARAQAPGPASATAVQPAAATAEPRLYPIDVELSTVADHPGEFAGQAIRLRLVRVDRVISPTLVKLKGARENGPYHFGTLSRPDRLLAVLPAGARVAKGDILIVAGTLRTVRGAALSKEATGKDDKLVKHGNRPVLVSTTATTIDGADLR